MNHLIFDRSGTVSVDVKELFKKEQTKKQIATVSEIKKKLDLLTKNHL